MKRAGVFLLLLVFAFSQSYYQVALVLENGTPYSLVYDDASFSYTDNSQENPNVYLRVCALSQEALLHKWIALVYADGVDGDYVEIDNGPYYVDYVPPSNCVLFDVDISSFRALYPAIPFVIISDEKNLSSGSRWKLSRRRGWFIGNYTFNLSLSGDNVSINVTAALDDTFTPITPDMDFLVIGLVAGDGLTTIDTALSSPGNPVVLSFSGYKGDYTVMINGIGGIEDTLSPYVEILSPEDGKSYEEQELPFVFIIMDNEEVDKCWYVLDSSPHSLPDCFSTYILSLSPGSHTLCLYANDTFGNVGRDCVAFSVISPSKPPERQGAYYKGGYFYKPQPIPSVPSFTFTIHPSSIILDYYLQPPYFSSTTFRLCSSHYLPEVSCVVKGKHSQYYNISFPSFLNATCEEGKLSVFFPVTLGLEISDDEALLECYGKVDNTIILLSKASIYVNLFKPLLSASNKSLVGMEGMNYSLSYVVVNLGEADAVNVTLSPAPGYVNWLLPQRVERIPSNSSFSFNLTLSIPEGTKPGIYKIPIIIKGDNTEATSYYLFVTVKERFRFAPCSLSFHPVVFAWLLLLAIYQPVLFAYRKRYPFLLPLLIAILLVLLWIFLTSSIISRCYPVFKW